MKFNYQRVSLQEDYVFGSVMSNPQLCLKLIRLILPELVIDRVEFVERQKVAEDQYHSHGVRFDIYTRDTQQNVYNIEMQVRHVKGLAQRARYYHSKMDSDNLGKKQDYRNLKRSYVIFICLFDPFGLGRYKYEFKRFCLLDKPLPLDDGQSTIFLNAKGVADDVNPGLVNFLKFVDNKEVNDEYVNEIKAEISQCINDQEWRQKYMDNETHMLFHDMDLQELTRQETRSEDLAAIRLIARCQAEGMAQQAIIDKVKTKFAFTDQDVQQVLLLIQQLSSNN